MLSHNYHSSNTTSARRSTGVPASPGTARSVIKSTLASLMDGPDMQQRNYVLTSDTSAMKRSSSIPYGSQLAPPDGTRTRRHSIAEVTHRKRQPNLFAVNYLNDFLMNRGFLPQRSLFHKDDCMTISMATTADPVFLPTTSIKDEEEYLSSISAPQRHEMQAHHSSSAAIAQEEDRDDYPPLNLDSADASTLTPAKKLNNPFLADLARGAPHHDTNPFLNPPSIMDSLNENNDLSLASMDTLNTTPDQKKKTKRTHVSGSMTPMSIAVIVSIKEKPMKMPRIIVNLSSNVSIHWYNGLPTNKSKYEEFYQLNSVNWKLSATNYNIYIPANSYSADDVQQNLDIDVIRDYVVFKNKKTSHRKYVENKASLNKELQDMLNATDTDDSKTSNSAESSKSSSSQENDNSTISQSSETTSKGGNDRSTNNSNGQNELDDDELFMPGDYVFVIPVAFANRAPETLTMPSGRVFYRLKILTNAEAVDDNIAERLLNRPPLSTNASSNGAPVTISANDLDCFKSSGTMSHFSNVSTPPPLTVPPSSQLQACPPETFDSHLTPGQNYATSQHKARQLSLDYSNMHSNNNTLGTKNTRQRAHSSVDTNTMKEMRANRRGDQFESHQLSATNDMKTDRRKRSGTNSWFKSIKDQFSTSVDNNTDTPDTKSLTGKISPISMSRKGSVTDQRRPSGELKANVEKNKYSIFIDEPINIVRMPPEQSLTTADKPVYVNKVWADSLAYEVSFGKKYVPINSEVPLVIKLSPLVKDIEIKRIRVSVVETIKYSNINRKYEYDQLDPILKDPFSPYYRDLIARKKKTRSLPLLEIRSREIGNKALCEEVVEGCLNDNLLSYSSVTDECTEFNRRKNTTEKKTKSVPLIEPICVETTLKLPNHMDFDRTTAKNLPPYGIESFVSGNADDDWYSSRQSSVFGFFKSQKSSNSVNSSPSKTMHKSRTKIFTEGGITVNTKTRHHESHRGLYLDSSYFRNINSKHKLEIMLRIKKTDENDPTVAKNFEIVIDTPIYVVSEHCSNGNTELPTYNMALSDSTKVMLASNNVPPPTFEEATSSYSSPFASPSASPRIAAIAGHYGGSYPDYSPLDMSRSGSISVRSDLSVDTDLPNVDHLMASLPPVSTNNMIDSVRSTYNNLDGLLSSHSSLANKRETSNRSGVDGFDTTSNNGSDMNKPRNFPIITVSAADELFKKDYSIMTTNGSGDYPEPPKYETVVGGCDTQSNH